MRTIFENRKLIDEAQAATALRGRRAEDGRQVLIEHKIANELLGIVSENVRLI